MIQKILIQSPDGVVCSFLFLSKELYSHCSNPLNCMTGEWEATLVIRFPWARNFTDIAPAHPAAPIWVPGLDWGRYVKVGPSWKHTSLVDAAIQGKINNALITSSKFVATICNHFYCSTSIIILASSPILSIVFPCFPLKATGCQTNYPSKQIAYESHLCLDFGATALQRNGYYQFTVTVKLT